MNLARIGRQACLIACMALAGSLAVSQDSSTAPLPVVALQTSLGSIEIELDTTHAPVTAQNFLQYVDAKRFDGVTIYRAVKIGDDGKYGLVQGGIRGDRKRAFPPIAHESPSVTGLSHRDATISMAREAPGSATGDFFFIVGDLVSLDGAPARDDPGYAVFGRVIAGMDIVRSILDLPRSETADQEVMKGQMLAEPVKITTARRMPVPAPSPAAVPSTTPP